MKDLKTKLETAEQNIGKIETTCRESLPKLAEAARTKVKTCQESLKKLKSAHKKFGPYIATLETELESYELSLGSTSNAALDRTTKLLDTLNTKVLGANPLCTQVEQVITQIQENLKKPELSKFFGQRKKLLETRLEKSVLVTTYQQPPADSLATTSALKVFQSELNELVTRATKNVTDFAEVLRMAENAEKRLKEDVFKTIFKSAPKLLDQIKGKIEAAKKPSESPMVGKQSLKEIELQLDTYAKESGNNGKASKPGETLLNREAMLKEAELKGEERKEQMAGALAVFSKNELRRCEEVSKKVVGFDSNKLDEINRLYKQAEKFAGKKQWDRATETLSRAKQTAAEFLDNPLQPRLAAKASLGFLDKRWRSAVGNYAKEVFALADTIASAATEKKEQEQVAYAVKTIRSLGSLFNPTAFSEIVKSMTPEDVDIKVLRRSKEEGLRMVRAYRQRVTNDPLLLRVCDPTVNTISKVSVSRIVETLSLWELNLKRA